MVLVLLMTGFILSKKQRRHIKSISANERLRRLAQSQQDTNTVPLSDGDGGSISVTRGKGRVRGGYILGDGE